jgi:hypothetical protein
MGFRWKKIRLRGALPWEEVSVVLLGTWSVLAEVSYRRASATHTLPSLGMWPIPSLLLHHVGSAKEASPKAEQAGLLNHRLSASKLVS